MSLLFILFALAPSLIWLALYLRQDAHPEPKRIIVRVFLLGMVAALCAAFVEWILLCNVFVSPSCGRTNPGLGGSPLWPLGHNIALAIFISEFVGIALVEEVSKFLAARAGALSSKYFDEPVDAMLYLIIAALGFATVENMSIMLRSEIVRAGLNDVAALSLMRFVGATFLHTTAAGLTGYFVALGMMRRTQRTLFISIGLLCASFVHWLFNAFITDLAKDAEKAQFNQEAFFNLVVLLAVSGFIIFSLLRHLRALSFAHTFGKVAMAEHK